MPKDCREPRLPDVFRLTKGLNDELKEQIRSIPDEAERQLANNILNRCYSSISSVARFWQDEDRRHHWQRRVLSTLIDELTHLLMKSTTEGVFREVCLKALCVSSIGRRAIKRLTRDKKLCRVKKLEPSHNVVSDVMELVEI